MFRWWGGVPVQLGPSCTSLNMSGGEGGSGHGALYGSDEAGVMGNEEGGGRDTVWGFPCE